MSGESNLQLLLKTMRPLRQPGEYVFCKVASLDNVNTSQITGFFREEEGITIILRRELADLLHFDYTIALACITLTVHSSLQAVGLTASFSTALSAAGISCNVVAAFYHDHIFVPWHDAEKAMNTLLLLSGA